jgi:hypothetical protein
MDALIRRHLAQVDTRDAAFFNAAKFDVPALRRHLARGDEPQADSYYRASWAREAEWPYYINRTRSGYVSDKGLGVGKRVRGSVLSPNYGTTIWKWNMNALVSERDVPGQGDWSWGRRGMYAVPGKRVRIGEAGVGQWGEDIITAVVKKGIDGVRRIGTQLYKELFGVRSAMRGNEGDKLLNIEDLPDQARYMFRYVPFVRHLKPPLEDPEPYGSFTIGAAPERRPRRIRDRTSRFNLTDVPMIDALEKATRKLVDRDPGRNVKAKIEEID